MTDKRKDTREKAFGKAPPARPKKTKTAKKKHARGSAGSRAGTTRSSITRKVAKAPKNKKTATKKAPKSKQKPVLRDVVLEALEDMKAVDVKMLDVRRLTDVTDMMVVASGTSDRHVKSIADRVLERCREAGFRPLGIEGEQDGEWVLLDLYDLVLHVMQPRVRDFYALEKLWEGGGAAA
jgi:ribosome-associated protein